MKRKSIYLVLLALIFTSIAFYKKLAIKSSKNVSGPLHINLSKPENPQWNILVVGDTGTGNGHQKSVAEAMEKYCKEENPDFVLMLGDNFYQAGVSSITDPQWKTKWQDMYKTDCLGTKQFYVVLGNHDYKRNPEVQIEYANIDTTWNLPNRFYNLKLNGVANFIAMDTNVNDVCLFMPSEKMLFKLL